MHLQPVVCLDYETAMGGYMVLYNFVMVAENNVILKAPDHFGSDALRELT